jgi:hypothetical protein
MKPAFVIELTRQDHTFALVYAGPEPAPVKQEPFHKQIAAAMQTVRA